MYVCIAEHKGTKEKPFTEFTYSVVVDGVTYKGTGRSKNEAKSAAAKAALIGRFKILSVPSKLYCHFKRDNFGKFLIYSRTDKEGIW